MGNEINLQNNVIFTIISVLSEVNEHQRRQMRNSKENILMHVHTFQSFASDSVWVLEGTIIVLNIPYLYLQVYL
jgi:hypothetical protein